MMIIKGLIIADPWIGYILDGSKDWEMRSSGASHRDWFALIRKGTGAVYGVARLVDVGSPLSPAQMIATFEHHRIPAHMIQSGEVAKWNTPWKLSDVRRFDCPVPYRHKSGAVTWVELDEAAIDGVASRFEAWDLTVNSEVARPFLGDLLHDRVGNANRVQHCEVLRSDIKGEDPMADVTVRTKPRLSTGATQTGSPLTIPTTTASHAATGRVIGEVEITDGNITNSHIYLRTLFDRFPADAIGGSNKSMRAKHNVTIDWGGAELVQTDLDGQKKFFRARSWIGAFFQLHRAKAGDRVVVEEIAPHFYRVSLKRYGSQGTQL